MSGFRFKVSVSMQCESVNILSETTETCNKFVSSFRRNKHIYVIAADQNLGK